MGEKDLSRERKTKVLQTKKKSFVLIDRGLLVDRI